MDLYVITCPDYGKDNIDKKSVKSLGEEASNEYRSCTLFKRTNLQVHVYPCIHTKERERQAVGYRDY